MSNNNSNNKHVYKAKAATFYGAGVGPGDPLLLTLKTHQLIQSADVISYIANTDGHSQAREIASYSIETRTIAAEEVMVKMPMPMKWVTMKGIPWMQMALFSRNSKLHQKEITVVR